MAKPNNNALGGFYKQLEDQKQAEQEAALAANPFCQPQKVKAFVVKDLRLNAAGARLGLIYSELLGLPVSKKGRRR
jgi:hypothetical protein